MITNLIIHWESFSEIMRSVRCAAAVHFADTVVYSNVQFGFSIIENNDVTCLLHWHKRLSECGGRGSMNV